MPCFQSLTWSKQTAENGCGRPMVPLAGIEPALLAELDFESSASTSSATGALAAGSEPGVTKFADYSRGKRRVNPR